MLHIKTDEIYGKNPITNSSDLRTHLISIDSRFRHNLQEPSSDFQYRTAHPYKNVIKARVASVEIPAVIYNFSKAKKNTMFRIEAMDYTGQQHYLPIGIEDGEYTAEQLLQAITHVFQAIRDTLGIFFRITLDPMTKKVTIHHDGSAPPPCPPAPTHCPVTFGLTFAMIGLENRPFDFGLGSYLGFSKPFYEVNTPFHQTAESLIQTQGDDYFLLGINDFHTVEHKTHDSYLQCLAKVLVNRSHPSSQQSIMFHPGYTVLSNEITFPKPQDLSIFRIRLLDKYGVPVDLHDMNYSISLELTEVMNLQLYENYRNYLWSVDNQSTLERDTSLGPRAKKQTSGSSAPIAHPAMNYN